MPVERTPPKEDKTWIALMASLAALTELLRYVSEENNISKDEAMLVAVAAIRKITAALEEFNL